jgi:DNA polymerase-3 subunit epsilon
MNFTDIRKTAWDTETTGPNPLEDRIVTAAFIVRGGGHEDRVFSWLIDPKVPIPAEASEVHGITDDMVKADGRDPKEALDEIASTLATAITHGMPVIAFNQSFDWSILHYDLTRHGLSTVHERVGPGPLPLLDPHVIDKQVDKYVKGTGMRKLKPTAERYGVELTDWHTAEADALAAMRWMVRHDLWKRGIPYTVITPSKRITYATGTTVHKDEHGQRIKGDALKALVQAAVGERYGIHTEGRAKWDEADAYVMLAMGMHWLGYPLAEVPPGHAAALAGCTWPDREAVATR